MNKNEFESLFAGKYEYIRLLGKGGFAEVYLARDKMLEREVAIKILLSQYSEDTEIKERFIREARLYAKLDHKNVIPVYDTGIINGNAFIVMKYIKGQSLKELINSGKKIDFIEIKKIIRDLADALNYIHENGIVHRDIKPANILIENRTGKYYIADFGIARSESSNTLTQTGLIIGTPHYLSPEQIKGKRTDNRSDIYSFGAMLYELVSGRAIFQGVSSIEILYQHVNEEPEDIKKLVPNCPDEIVFVIQKCLEKDPNNRFQNALEIIDALEGSLTQRISTKKEENKGLKRILIILVLFTVIISSYFIFVKSFKKEIKRNNQSNSVLNGDKIKKENKVKINNDLKKDKVKEKSDIEKKKNDNLTNQKNKSNDLINKKEKDKINKNLSKKTRKITTESIKKPNKETKKKDKIINNEKVNNLPGRVKFSSSYPAKVFLNKKLIGSTEQIFYKEFKPGTYKFVFYVDSLMRYEKKVKIEPGKTINLHQKIDSFGVITILTKPLAKIYFNGKYIGESPLYKLKVPVGNYKVRVVKEGFIPEEREIEIKREKKNINFILKRRKK